MERKNKPKISETNAYRLYAGTEHGYEVTPENNYPSNKFTLEPIIKLKNTFIFITFILLIKIK